MWSTLDFIKLSFLSAPLNYWLQYLRRANICLCLVIPSIWRNIFYMHKNEVCISGALVIYSGTVRKGRLTNSRDPVYEIKPADSKKHNDFSTQENFVVMLVISICGLCWWFNQRCNYFHGNFNRISTINKKVSLYFQTALFSSCS